MRKEAAEAPDSDHGMCGQMSAKTTKGTTLKGGDQTGQRHTLVSLQIKEILGL